MIRVCGNEIILHECIGYLTSDHITESYFLYGYKSSPDLTLIDLEQWSRFLEMRWVALILHELHWLSGIWSYSMKLFLVGVETFPRFDSHLSFSHQLVKHRTWVEERLVRVLLMPTWKAGLGLASIHTHKQWMVRYKFIPCLTAEKTTPPKVINLIIKWFQLVFAYVAANKVI